MKRNWIVPRAIAPSLIAMWVVCVGCDSRPAPTAADWAARAQRDQTSSSYATALDAALVFGDVALCAELGLDAKQRFEQPDDELAGLVVLALWRAGLQTDAREAAERLDDTMTQTRALEARLHTALLLGDDDTASSLAYPMSFRDDLSFQSLRDVVAALRIDARFDDALRATEKVDEAIQAMFRVNAFGGGGELDLEHSLGNEFRVLIDASATWERRVRGSGVVPLGAHAAMRMPVVRLRIGDNDDVRCILDTGAGATVLLAPYVLEEAGIDIGERRILMAGFGGATSANYTFVDAMHFGDVRVAQVVVATAEESPILKLVDGLVGTGLFRGSRVTLDFENEQMHIERSSADDPAGHAFYLLVSPSGHLFAEGRIGDHSVSLFLDTGADMSIVSSRWLARVMPDREPLTTPLPMFGVGDSIGQVRVVSLGELEFAGRVLSHVGAMVNDDAVDMLGEFAGVGTDIVLGMPEFREMNSITMDLPRRRGWVVWRDE